MSNDKAGKELWDRYWVESEIPSALDPHQLGFKNAKVRRYHEYFSKTFSELETRGLKLLEIGCARSVWLPYFAKEFGFKVYGLDYSEIGCEQSRQVLSKAGVEGDIICANFFNPPDNLLNTFDVIVSFGVIEHFEDTVTCLSAFSNLLKCNGIIITNIPNLNGLNGLIFKVVNRSVFDTHVLLDLEALLKAHELAGFKPLNCNYFLTIDFGIPNLVGLDPQTLLTRLKNVFRSNLIRLGKVIWAIEERFGHFDTTKFLSPYIIFVGNKK